MNILVLESPAVSKFGNQRIYGGFGSNKSESNKPPLDMMWISGYLRQSGFDNILLDANASRKTYDDVKDVIKESDIHLVIFSTSTCTIEHDINVARVAKEVDPKIVTVAIGINIMAFPEKTVEECEYLDVAIYSKEWEYISAGIARNISDLSFVKGIVFRDSDDEIVKNSPQPDLTDLDELGFPAHDMIQRSLYKDALTKRYPKTMVMGSRGCIGNCSYCCQPAYWGKLRKRSVEHIIEELKWVKKLGFREVMFNDATLTADRQWSLNIFKEMISNKIDLSWICTTRADCLDKETLSFMKKAGCHSVLLGLESANKEILKNIRKGVTPEQIKEAVSLIRKTGMDALVFCVIGFPGETKESILETIEFVKRLDTSYITLGIAAPYPNTDFYKYLKENNYLLTDDWSLYDPMKTPVFSYPQLSSNEIHYYASYGLRQFYLRPRYILDRLLSIRNINDIKKLSTNFWGFIRRYVLGVQK